MEEVSKIELIKLKNEELSVRIEGVITNIKS